MTHWTKASGRTGPPLGSAEEALRPGRWEGLQSRGRLEDLAAGRKPSRACRSQGFVLIPLTPPLLWSCPGDPGMNKACHSQQMWLLTEALQQPPKGAVCQHFGAQNVRPSALHVPMSAPRVQGLECVAQSPYMSSSMSGLCSLPGLVLAGPP